MAEYVCEECGALFTEPLTVTERTYADPVHPLDEQFWVCPYCNSDRFEKMKPCPKCGRYTQEDNLLCEKCQHGLKIRFANFLFGLDEAEKEQLDTWAEGVPLTGICDEEDMA